MKRVLLLGLLVACGKDDPPASPAPGSNIGSSVGSKFGSNQGSNAGMPQPPGPPDAAAAPVTRVALGACAPVGTAFESGPKPALFDPLMLRSGTTGIGGIGTRGGMGTGMGYGTRGGGASRGTSRTPMLAIGQPLVEGDLDKVIVRRYLKRNVAKLTYCYERELEKNPKLEGEVTASFVITAIGAVQEAKATGVDPKVEACVAGVLSAIEFPKPQGGGVVRVKLPLRFQPPQDIQITRDTTPYVPGEHSPLRGHEAKLAACFTQPYGVGVVEFDDTGVKVRGVDDQAAACITAVAKEAKSQPQACSFAYGTMPVDKLPTLDDKATAADIDRVAKRPAGDVPIVGPILVRSSDRVVGALLTKGRIDVIVETPPTLELPVVPVPVGTGTTY